MFKYSISRQGEECKDKMCVGKLCAVLASMESDSAQCKPARSPTPRSVCHFWNFNNLKFKI